MQHPDPDVLALIALGEPVESAEDRAHLATCGECRDEVRNLARAAAVGRSTLTAGTLVTPDDRVWDRIASEVGHEDVAVKPLPVVRPFRRRRLIAVLAAAALVAAAGVVSWQAVRSAQPQVLATAALEPFPGWPDASGSASVQRLSDGMREMEITIDAPGEGDGYREVWLITSDASELVSLGVVTGESAVFPIPAGIDLSRYDLVDISEEPYDGDPIHSGDSIVRGKLA